MTVIWKPGIGLIQKTTRLKNFKESKIDIYSGRWLVSARLKIYDVVSSPFRANSARSLNSVLNVKTSKRSPAFQTRRPRVVFAPFRGGS